jgi:hypothetical protein
MHLLDWSFLKYYWSVQMFHNNLDYKMEAGRFSTVYFALKFKGIVSRDRVPTETFGV